MNTTTKTVIYVAAAAALAFVAALSSPGGVEPVFFQDTGESFFPHLVQPDQAASLEIWSFDAATGEVVPFAVKKADGVWKIPSHFDYPADAKDRMATAAGLFVGLTMASVRSDRRDDHAKFGVVDPMGEGLELEGRGMRVTFKDKSGAVLADMIIGKEVEGRDGTRYVRLADKKRTYTAKLPGEVSTKFGDWIERDLLGVTSADLETVTFDNYSVDETRGVVVPGEKVTMQKKDFDWTLPDLTEEEEFVKDKANDAVATLTGLQIVDVRRKPDGLTAKLERAQGISREILMDNLARRGFFLSRDKLYSNEGDLLANTKKGVVYTLKFGEIVYGSGETAEASTKKEGETPENGESKDEAARRYLMITAEFDETLLAKPEGTPLTEEHLDQRQKARVQVDKIANAVRTYRTTHSKLPANLTDLTTGDNPPLAALESDPWEQAYVLVERPPTEEGSEPEFAVLSYGADKAAGGDGEGTDIASDARDRETELRKVCDDHKAYAKKVEDGKKAAAELTARFGPWYYVIDAESFGKLHLSRSDLVKAKEKEPEEVKSDGDQPDK